ncbi:MAG: DNA repair protein RadC [Clostridium sp.]|nr:DNA repair protein RadC [Clostridium sp.]MCM1398808.1 DNA repair protein RadC [Clostridium sp.]MCM1458560.1 DNA repair protein RadC [Bacteroides sp.]
MNNLIRDIADCERPYEKAVLYGIAALSDAELVAVILRNGTRDTSSVDLANRILNAHFYHKGLSGLNFLRREELTSIKGVGDIKATQLLAVAELAKRMNTGRLREDITFSNPKSIAAYFMEKCKYATKEQTYLMLFSTAHRLIKELLMSEGTVNYAIISPREIYIEALKYEAVFMILVHNHPSGIPEPSDADMEATRRICEAGRLVGIQLSDHIIVGNNCYVSMLERGILK